MVGIPCSRESESVGEEITVDYFEKGGIKRVG